MANTFFGLTIAQSGLFAANIALNTTGHNISNEQTEGYSRQQVSQTASRALQVYQQYGMVGTGTTVTGIEQLRDSYYDFKYWNNNSKVAYFETLYDQMINIEDFFNEINTDGFTAEYGNFFNAMTSLLDDPASYTARTSVIGYAENIMEYFNTMKQNLLNLQEDINEEVKDNVDRINTLAADIAALNKQINIVELTGEVANDLRDRRNLLVDELSGIVEVSVTEEKVANNKTEYKVMLGGNTLVDNYTAFQLKVVSREERRAETDAVGLYDVQWAWGDSFDPVHAGYEGKLKALLEVRDGNNCVGDIPTDYKGVVYYTTELNYFLENLTSRFNEIHKDGYNLNGDKISDLDDADFFLFEDGVYKVNPKYIEDPGMLGLSSSPIQNGEDNTDILSKLIDIQYERTYDGSTGEDFMQSILAEIAIDARKADTLEANYSTMKHAIINQRLSVSGVDTDEETMNLVKFQEAYELAAQMISIMQEIYNKLINEMGV
ncbi:MAG: flagellar hook-associated protein FlgK [Lachnospiraceae bacterium]|nr:flagellar hook-associated protein FlgK [Lachnospiraceae bacterium]